MTNHLKKALFDKTMAIIAIIALSPVFLILCILVPVFSWGPPFYRQKRIGQFGKQFDIYKFRSMVHNAEQTTGPVIAQHADERITKIGRVLRRTHLDEIPQLFNVLKGDMSLVGPRPERPFFVDQFMNMNADYSRRLQVKPGLTGLAQIKETYDASFEDKLKYDLSYINNLSLWLDIKIIVMTFFYILNKRVHHKDTNKYRHSEPF